MFTPHGIDLLLKSLLSFTGQTGVKFISNGSLVNIVFPVDPGYPKVGDTDKANDSKGDNVITWKITVPRGNDFRPATQVILVDNKGETIYKTDLPEPFKVGPTQPSTLYLNVIFQR